MLKSLFNFIVVKSPWLFPKSLGDLLGQAGGQKPIKFIALMSVF